MSKAPTEALTLAEQIGTAERELHALLLEQGRLAGMMHDAAQAADADEMVRLRRRADELPAYIFAGKARVLRLQVTQLEGQLAEAEAERGPAQQALAEAEQRLTAARTAHTEALTVASNVSAGYQSVRADLATRKRMLQDLMREVQHDSAPVVRSRPHAVTA